LSIFFFKFNLLKGGLISLAAATVGLTTEAAQHLEVRGCQSLAIFVILNYSNFILGGVP